MKKVYNSFLIISFFCSFGMIISCEDELQKSATGSYVNTTDSLTASIKSSVDSLENKNEQLDEAMNELSGVFNEEI